MQTPNAKPYYERSLDSFADDVITSVRPGRNGLWYAVLDVGPNHYPGDPDFSTCCDSNARAIAECAKKIRNDAKGVGKYAPHSILVTPYDFHFRLAKHWASKEERDVITQA